MEISTLLEDLKRILKDSPKVPFSDKCVVDREQVLSMIEEIVFKLPDELKQAKWIKEERERIIAEAQKDAEDIVKEAENRIISMIDEHEITKKAYEKKDEIIADANKMYREMAEGTNSYVDEILANIETNMQELSKCLNNVETTVNGEIEKIQSNRKELK